MTPIRAPSPTGASRPTPAVTAVTPFVTPPRSEAVTRFVELSWAPEDLRRPAGGAPLYARLTAPSRPLEGEAGATPLRLTAIADLSGIVIDAPVPPCRLTLAPAARDVRDRAVLIRTGWSPRQESRDDRPCRPYLGEATVDALLAGGAALVGVDFPSVDCPRPGAPAACERLLRAGIVVVVRLCNLSALPERGFRFYAVPLRGGSSTPVRAFAELLPP
jgi:arylformamidase